MQAEGEPVDQALRPLVDKRGGGGGRGLGFIVHAPQHHKQGKCMHPRAYTMP
jgi:hypothetical protein